jgi:hypothetical protein
VFADLGIYLYVCAQAYLPGLDPDTIHGSEHVDISYCNIRYTCFCVVPAQSAYADSMAWSTIHIVYIYVAASCLDGDAVVTCIE